jgi:hypothetical protein
MTGTASNVAHFNYGVMRARYDDPSMAAFVEGYEPVHAIAERSEGFVWRYDGSEAEDAAALGRALPGHPLVICSFSVWKRMEDWDHFIHKTLHGRFLGRRNEWFEPGRSEMVLWHVPEGHLPDMSEALDRLDQIRAEGPSDEVWTLASWKARGRAM